MDYILDTHVLLWSMFDSVKLSQLAQNVLLDRQYRRFVSIVSVWEIAIKNRIGKLPLPGGLEDIFYAIAKRGYGIVDINRRHIEIFSALPLVHRDPFDGIIIATALREQMTIITADEHMQKYDVPWVW